MNQIPSQNIFKEPEGYFDDLFVRIQYRNQVRENRMKVYRLAAAAVIVLGMFLAIFIRGILSDNHFQAQMDEEVELYINSGYWEAEDVLVLSEDPDELLDLIIVEEWSDYPLGEDQVESEVWY